MLFKVFADMLKNASLYEPVNYNVTCYKLLWEIPFSVDACSQVPHAGGLAWSGYNLYDFMYLLALYDSIYLDEVLQDHLVTKFNSSCTKFRSRCWLKQISPLQSWDHVYVMDHPLRAYGSCTYWDSQGSQSIQRMLQVMATPSPYHQQGKSTGSSLHAY